MANLTKDNIIDLLEKADIEFDPKAKKADLESLLPEERLKPKEDEKDEKRLQPSSEDLPVSEEGDYIRKFQYRKETVPGSVESDPQPGSKAAIMKKSLLKQERVRIFVPRSSGESTAVKLSVNLDGYRLDLPKQAYLEVPLQISKVVMDSLAQTEEAILRGQITGDIKKEDALL